MIYITIFGPQAVGKMTVGEELSKQLNIPLFHNHVSIDLVLKYLEWSEGQQIISSIREDIMTTMVANKKPGLIFTFIWDFASQADWDFMTKNNDIFKDYDKYYIELYSDVDTRLERNITENRLEKKWTKRNTAWSNNELVESMDRHRMTSHDNEVPYKNYIKIDNTNLSPTETATLIIKHFNLHKV